MRFIILLAILAFPIAEIWMLITLAHHYGWWLLFYLVAIAALGLQLISSEKLLFSGRMMQSLTQGGNPMKAMFGSARNIFAGILLIIPGVMTDLIAVVLLLIPMPQAKAAPAANDASGSTHQEGTYQETPFKQQRQASNDDVIEGEFTKIKEETDQK